MLPRDRRFLGRQEDDLLLLVVVLGLEVHPIPLVVEPEGEYGCKEHPGEEHHQPQEQQARLLRHDLEQDQSRDGQHNVPEPQRPVQLSREGAERGGRPRRCATVR